VAESRCSVCQHPARSAVDQALVSGRTFRGIAEEYGLSKDAVRRHRDRHLTQAMRGALASAEGRAGRTALGRLEGLYGRADAILGAAEAGGQGALALGAIKELRGIVELLARITGELDERPQVTVNLLQSSEWLSLQAQILGALTPYPDARAALAGVLVAGDVVAGEVVPC